jgi:hypothetical protein
MSAPIRDGLEYVTVTAPYLNPDGTRHIDRPLDITIRDGVRPHGFQWTPLVAAVIILILASRL